MKFSRRFGWLVAGVVVLLPAAAFAEGCSFYDSGEGARQSLDVKGPGSGGNAGGGQKKDDYIMVRIGHEVGDDGKGISYIMPTPPPDFGREGRAMIDSFRDSLGKQHLDRRVVDRNVTIAKPIGGTTLGAGMVAQLYTR